MIDEKLIDIQHSEQPITILEKIYSWLNSETTFLAKLKLNFWIIKGISLLQIEYKR